MMKLALSVILLVTLGLTLGMATAGDEPKKGADAYIKVEVKGKLQTGIVAIGGETTGTIIATPKGTLELDFGKNKELRALAEKLNGKNAVVNGTLTIRRGVEIRQRFIVAVTGLKGAD